MYVVVNTLPNGQNRPRHSPRTDLLSFPPKAQELTRIRLQIRIHTRQALPHAICSAPHQTASRCTWVLLMYSRRTSPQRIVHIWMIDLLRVIHYAGSSWFPHQFQCGKNDISWQHSPAGSASSPFLHNKFCSFDFFSMPDSDCIHM